MNALSITGIIYMMTHSEGRRIADRTELARAFEQAGVAAVIVHGRTRQQGFTGKVNRSGIRAVVQAVDRMPIVANGDIRSIADAAQTFEETGCQAISIGRGALANPFIFQQSSCWNMNVREIWIKSGQKVSPALSNDFDLSLPELVAALTGRWGNQENMFKDLKDHGIDRIHSYQNEPYSAEHLYDRGLEDRDKDIQHEIGNPEIRKINQELKALRTDREKLEQRIEAATKRDTKEVTGLRKKLAGLVRQSKIELPSASNYPRPY